MIRNLMRIVAVGGLGLFGAMAVIAALSGSASTGISARPTQETRQVSEYVDGNVRYVSVTEVTYRADEITYVTTTTRMRRDPQTCQDITVCYDPYFDDPKQAVTRYTQVTKR